MKPFITRSVQLTKPLVRRLQTSDDEIYKRAQAVLKKYVHNKESINIDIDEFLNYMEETNLRRMALFYPQEYANHLRVEIEKQIPELAEKMGVKRKIHVIVSRWSPGIQAFGGLPFQRAGIRISPKVCYYSPKFMKYIAAHELAHLYYKDTNKRIILVAWMILSNMLIVKFGFPLIACFPATVIPYSRYVEKRADRFAIKYLNIRELQDLLKIDKEDLEYEKKKGELPSFRNFWKKIKIPSLSSLLHTSLEDRISMVEKEISAKQDLAI